MPGWHLWRGSGSGPGFQCRASVARHSGWRRRDRSAPGARGRTGPTFPSSLSCSDRSRAEMSKAQASSNLRAHSFSAGESAEGPAWRWLPPSRPGSRLGRPVPGAEPPPRPCKLPKTFLLHPQFNKNLPLKADLLSNSGHPLCVWCEMLSTFKTLLSPASQIPVNLPPASTHFHLKSLFSLNRKAIRRPSPSRWNVN